MKVQGLILYTIEANGFLHDVYTNNSHWKRYL